MYKLFKIISIIITINVTVAFAGSIGNVNSTYVIDKSSAWLGVVKDIENQAKSIQIKIINKQKKLEMVWSEIKQMRSDKKTDQKIVDLELEFQQGNIKLQEYVQKEKIYMDTVFLNTKKIIQNKVKQIVKDIAIENNMDTVMNVTELSVKSSIIYTTDEFSITDEVLKRLNNQLPKIILDFKGK